MDPALIKEREKFKKRALANATTEKKIVNKQTKYDPFKNKSTNDEYSSIYTANITSTLTSTSFATHKFNILAKIVKHLKERYLNGYSDFITLEEIFDEMRLSDINQKIRLWLETEALPNNPKVKIGGIKSSDGSSRYMFKAPIDIRDKRSLLKLLAHRDENGLGAVTVEEIEESLPGSENILKQIEDSAIILTRPGDKKRILFHNDESCNFTVHPEFARIWKNTNLEGVDETHIEAYLREKGINAMKAQSFGLSGERVFGKRRRRINLTNRPAKPVTIKFNEHMANVLEDYSIHKK